ncbi:DUF5999 family protein [Paractinoplanes brasiliensis]|uniref:Uncharacterized protein n=1 Tax=Paractinoplanes brasiliensis TaxID=52695 RepID=A0A4V6PSP4_9ACTN|nr:DUF5999 family protein [Actinoplanes brasiliensis]TDO32528.1 hypothetical protein C8E87_7993 [Actinoplanes brasiliensis]GID27596.1 hypothetical protein Abr02nite_25790 [Actinoplanes brasiliensis]
MCTHTPECPPIDQPGWDTAAVLVHHEDLGWSLLCNGAVVLDAVVRPEPAPTATVTGIRRRSTRTRRREPAPQPLAA